MANPVPSLDPHDPLRKSYRQSFVTTPAHFQFLISHDTALLNIDLQYLDAAPGHGVFKDTPAPIPEDSDFFYYFDSLEKWVIPNVKRIQETFRLYNLEVIHTRIQALTLDGRDRSQGHKRLGLLAPPGSREAEFLDEVAPRENEVVVNKTASGVFSSTNLHYVLANMGINSLFIAGVYTNECVETTVRDACDLGYLVTLVEDACTTVTPELHQASLQTLRDRYCRVVNTDTAIRDVENFAARVSPSQ
jgi:nicotinamidase-related amidase